MSVSNTPPPSSFCFLKIAFLHRRSKNNNKKKKRNYCFPKGTFLNVRENEKKKKKKGKIKSRFLPNSPRFKRRMLTDLSWRILLKKEKCLYHLCCYSCSLFFYLCFFFLIYLLLENRQVNINIIIIVIFSTERINYNEEGMILNILLLFVYFPSSYSGFPYKYSSNFFFIL